MFGRTKHQDEASMQADAAPAADTMLPDTTQQPVDRPNMEHHSSDDSAPQHHEKMKASSAWMEQTDPQNLSLIKKLHATIASWFAVFTLVYAATVATPVIPMVPMALGTSRTLANFLLTAPFAGVFFAPLMTPHLSEAFGRRPVYIVSLSLLLIFSGGISASKTAVQIIVLRALAGLVGGPLVVLIEGTHADVWPALKTVSYYCSIALAQYLGAAFGPIIGAQALTHGGVPWTAYTILMIGGFAWILVVTMPETYRRQLIRNAQKHDPTITLEPAPTGTKLSTMLNLTLITPLKMLVTEPLVIMGALLLGLVFGTVFMFFIAAPVVLKNVYALDNFTMSLTFFTAVAGSVIAFVVSLLIDSFGSKMKTADGMPVVEQRLMSAMLGVFLTTGGLLWVAFTAKPVISFIVPVAGLGVFVWGNMMILLSVVSYFFDAFHPQGILSALTAMACFRLACATIVPVFILDFFAAITPKWAIATFGFINALFIAIPFIMFFFGAKLRARSMYAGMGNGASPMMMKYQHHGEA